MDRRSFLARAGIATGSVAAVPLGAPAIAQDRRELKLVTSWAPDLPGLGSTADRFAAMIEQASDGRFTVRVFAGGELVGPLECHDAVQNGTADLYHSADYYYQDKIKAYAFFASVPFGFRPSEMDAWIHHGGGQALWDEIGAGFGIKHLVCGNTGPQMGGWFGRPMTTIRDFKGIKMRIPGLGGDMVEAVGGTSVTLADAEILPALEAGTVDAAEWVGPWNDLALGLYKVAKHYHYPGFHEPGLTLSLGVSKRLWDDLSGADQALFAGIAVAVNNLSLAEFTAKNSLALTTLVTEHGVEVHEFSDDLSAAFGAAAEEVLAAAGEADPLSGKVYRSFIAFRERAVAWSQLSEQSYMDKRARLGDAEEAPN